MIEFHICPMSVHLSAPASKIFCALEVFLGICHTATWSPTGIQPAQHRMDLAGIVDFSECLLQCKFGISLITALLEGYRLLNVLMHPSRTYRNALESFP